MFGLLIVSLASVPVQRANFVFTLDDVPLAVLSMQLDGASYLYESTHFLEEADGHFERRLTLDTGPRPEVLALNTRPALGCQDVLEERTLSVERLCIDQASGSTVRGRIDEAKFTATYLRGQLDSIDLGHAKWVRVDTKAVPHAANQRSPFADGFDVHPDERALRLDPALPGTRLVESVRFVGTGREGRCLPLARAYAEASKGVAKVIIGLVIEHGRAVPHAWVREGNIDLDPSVVPDDAVPARRYLEVPTNQAGRVYLELFSGARLLRGRIDP